MKSVGCLVHSEQMVGAVASGMAQLNPCPA